MTNIAIENPNEPHGSKWKFLDYHRSKCVIVQQAMLKHQIERRTRKLQKRGVSGDPEMKFPSIFH
jgi:hypothetical protein